MAVARAVSIRAHAAALAALTAAVCLAYASSFEAGFVLDSRAQIVDNPIVHTASAANVWYLATHDYWQPFSTGGLYRPLTSLTYLVDYAVLGNGARPSGYHLVNVALHLACVGLVYALLWQLTHRAWPTMFGAALFALHPIATEAVTNIVGRADLLAALGVLGGPLCHVRSLSTNGRARLLWRLGLAVAAAIAVFAKENGAVLLPLLFLFDAIQPSEFLSRRERLGEGIKLIFSHRRSGSDSKVPEPVPKPRTDRGPTRSTETLRVGHFIPSPDLSLRERNFRGRFAWGSYLATVPALLAYVALRSYAQSNSPLGEGISPLDNPLVEVGFGAALLTALKVVFFGLRLLLWPVHLSADYSFAEIVPVGWPPSVADVAAALAPIAALASLGFFFRRERVFLLLLGFYVIALLPTSNLVVFAGSIMAERFLYLPLFGFAGMVVLIAERVGFVSRRAADGPPYRANLVVTAVMGCVLLALAVRTSRRNLDWRDERSLWTATVRSAPNSAKAQKALANALSTGVGANLDTAIAAGERAVAIRPDYTGALVDLGGYYVTKGDAVGEPAAAPWYENAVEVLERARGQSEAARVRFLAASAAAGRGVPVYGNSLLANNLGLAYMRVGRFEDALAPYEEVRRLAPEAPSTYVDLSAVLANLGRLDDAASALWQSLAVRPGYADAVTRLIVLYRIADPQTTAVAIDGAGSPRLVAEDARAVSDRCRAYRALAEIFAQAQHPARAAEAAAAARAICS